MLRARDTIGTPVICSGDCPAESEGRILPTQVVNAMLGSSATEETRAAVHSVLSDAGLTGETSTLEDKGLPDIPLDPQQWDHFINIVIGQVQGLYEDTRGTLLGMLIENMRQRHQRRRAEAHRTPTDPQHDEPAPKAAHATAARELRQLVQDLQQLPASQATDPILVRLILDDLWVTCPPASTCGGAPFLVLLDSDFNAEEAGGFFGATRWDDTAQRWVPEDDEERQ